MMLQNNKIKIKRSNRKILPPINKIYVNVEDPTDDSTEILTEGGDSTEKLTFSEDEGSIRERNSDLSLSIFPDAVDITERVRMPIDDSESFQIPNLAQSANMDELARFNSEGIEELSTDLMEGISSSINAESNSDSIAQAPAPVAIESLEIPQDGEFVAKKEGEIINDKDRAVISILKLFISDTVTRQKFLKKFYGEDIVPFAALNGNSLSLGEEYTDKGVYETIEIEGKTYTKTEFMRKQQIQSLPVGKRFGIMTTFNKDAHFLAAIVTQNKPLKIKVFDPSYPKGLYASAHLTRDKLKSLGVDIQSGVRDLYEYPVCSECKSGGTCTAACQATPCQKSYLPGDSFCQTWSLMYLSDQNMRVPSERADAFEVAAILKDFFVSFVSSQRDPDMYYFLSIYWPRAINVFQDDSILNHNMLKRHFNPSKKSFSHFVNCVKNFPIDKLAYILENEY